MKFAVIGDPVAHSLSPAMHTAALKALGISGSYTPYHVTREHLPEFMKFARSGLDGFNVTVPHKNAVIPFLDEIEPEAAAAGSVNTVSVINGKLYGQSTDGYGLETAIREAFGITVCGKNIVFLGCGGAAKAAAFHFASHGAASVKFINRTVEKAEETARAVHTAFPGVRTDVLPLSRTDQIPGFLADAAILIQCTSIGLRDDDPSPVDPKLLPENVALYDTIYKHTALQRGAEAHGIRTSGGLGMLLHQGARSLEIWTKRPAPVEVMRNALIFPGKSFQTVLTFA